MTRIEDIKTLLSVDKGHKNALFYSALKPIARHMRCFDERPHSETIQVFHRRADSQQSEKHLRTAGPCSKPPFAIDSTAYGNRKTYYFICTKWVSDSNSSLQIFCYAYFCLEFWLVGYSLKLFFHVWYNFDNPLNYT